MLNKERIGALLKDSPFEGKLVLLPTIDSTNLEVDRLYWKGALPGTVVVSEEQTAGRGRRGRSWASCAGENLYFSLVLAPDFEMEKAPMLTLLMAIAVARTLHRKGHQAGIKWPNDVVIGGRKLCGILTEMRMEQDGYYVIIGTGLNVNQPAFPREIAQTATSLKRESGQEQDREELLAAILEAFAAVYAQFAKEGSLSGLKAEYEALLVNCGKEVMVLDPKGAWEGTAMGINETGELLVRHEDGHVEAVFAGEVSVRGIYGYV